MEDGPVEKDMEVLALRHLEHSAMGQMLVVAVGTEVEMEEEAPVIYPDGRTALTLLTLDIYSTVA